MAESTHEPVCSARPLVRVSATRGVGPGALAELWEYRELLYFLAWRDVKVRYRQTALGAAWAILQPALTMLVFSLFFGRLAGVPSDGIPYPLFALCGLVPWQLFAFALTNSANSLVASERLLTKIYFPRLIVPLASVLAGLVDFAVAFPLVVLALAWYRIPLTAALLAVPALVLLATAAALAVGVGLSALNVQYRDVRHALPFLSQFWMFLTPIAYPGSLLPARWHALYGLNPMAGVVEGFRWALVGHRPLPAALLLSALTATLLGLAVSVLHFRRVERGLADIV
jgi:lipopolysaccharide transport system permease protein